MLSTDAWTDVGTLDELDSTNGTDDGWPTVTPDGLTLYWESARGPNRDIYGATRPQLGATFGPLALVPGINDPMWDDGDPDISFDGQTLVFDSARGDGQHDDLYFSTRTN